MTNIIDTNKADWKTSDYVDTPDGERDIHQHGVKVADYVLVQGSESEMPTVTSETSYIGAYEYAPGGWITDHTHSNAEQWYYIVSGQGIMKVGSEERLAGQGTIIFVPRNTVHSYKVVGDEPLRLLNVAMPVREG